MGKQTVEDWSIGKGLLPGRDTLGPLLLMGLTPIVSIVFFHVCAYMNGDFVAFAGICYETGSVLKVLQSIWPDPFDVEVWKMILSFMSFELALMKLVPGKRFEASITPTGHVPVYTANGMACYLITLATLLLLAFLDLFDPAVVYDKFGNILASMNVFAWGFCTMLLVKGYVAPSSTDHGTTGNLVQDFYWVGATRTCARRLRFPVFLQTRDSHFCCCCFYWCRAWSCIHVSLDGMSRCSPTAVVYVTSVSASIDLSSIRARPSDTFCVAYQ
jgi:hypothetical protein